MIYLGLVRPSNPVNNLIKWFQYLVFYKVKLITQHKHYTFFPQPLLWKWKKTSTLTPLPQSENILFLLHYYIIIICYLLYYIMGNISVKALQICDSNERMKITPSSHIVLTLVWPGQDWDTALDCNNSTLIMNIIKEHKDNVRKMKRSKYCIYINFCLKRNCPKLCQTCQVGQGWKKRRKERKKI